jgi:hypothetical protein
VGRSDLLCNLVLLLFLFVRDSTPNSCEAEVGTGQRLKSHIIESQVKDPDVSLVVDAVHKGNASLGN